MSGIAPNQNTVFGLFSEECELTIADMSQRSDISFHQTIRTAGKLVETGFLNRLEAGTYVLSDQGIDAKRKGVAIRYGETIIDRKTTREPNTRTVRQRAWDAMNIFGTFSIPQLVAVVCNDPSKRDHLNIQRYCAGLRRAGYLLIMPTRDQGSALTSNGFKRYRLVNYTGELAPTFRAKKNEVFDHNQAEVVPCLN